MYTTVCLNSVFHNQLLSDTWQATILLPRRLPMPRVPALSPWSGSMLGTPTALTCLSATQISSALKHVSDLRTQKYKLLILLGTCCPHPFKVFLHHVSNFFRLLKKSRILSWGVLCKYPSLRETFGKYTFVVRNTKFHLGSVEKKHAVFLIIASRRTLRQKQKEETLLKKKRKKKKKRRKYVSLHQFHNWVFAYVWLHMGDLLPPAACFLI